MIFHVVKREKMCPEPSPRGLDRVLAFARHLLYLFVFERNMQGFYPKEE
jgi:hypothetical protein